MKYIFLGIGLWILTGIMCLNPFHFSDNDLIFGWWVFTIVFTFIGALLSIIIGLTVLDNK